MTEIEECLRAARVLIERGWCQNWAFLAGTGGSEYSLFGAIRNAAWGMAKGGTMDDRVDYAVELGGATLAKIRACVRRPIGDWHDARDRTRADVLAAIDATLASMAGADGDALLASIVARLNQTPPP